MATIASIIRGIEQARHSSIIFKNPGLSSATKTISSVLAHTEAVGRLNAQIQQFFERGRHFAELAAQLGWPPPWHMPVNLIDEIAQGYDQGELSRDDVEELFVQLYSPEVITEFQRRWEGYSWLQHRLPILREAVANHIDGRHYSAVCTLLPQIEGALGDELGRRPKPKIDAVAYFRDSHLGTVAKDFYVRVILESFEWTTSAPIPELSRHAVLHGRSTDYGTPKHSLKLLIITDIILDGIQDRRTNQAVPGTPDDE